MSVQFDELASLTPAHFGRFWERIRERFPRTEHHPPLPSVVELFGAQGAQPASLTVEAGFPVGRTWFLSEDGLRLLQLQPDCFVLNWRKLETATEYPRYETLRSEFENELGVFLAFLADNNLGEFQPGQCQLTYVNHIPSGLGWSARKDLAKVIVPWTGRWTEEYLPELEDAELAWQHRFERNGVPLGRLHFRLQSAVRNADRVPLFVLQVTARGAPLGGNVEGVITFLDQAHEWIVRGFAAATTKEMHKLWGRER